MLLPDSRARSPRPTMLRSALSCRRPVAFVRRRSGERAYTPAMARLEGNDESPEILDGYEGREWPAILSSLRVRIVAAEALALILAAVGGFYLGTRRDPPLRDTATADVVILPVPGGRPSGAGFAFGSIWVTTWDGFVVRFDPETRTVVKRVAVGGNPLAAQGGFGSVWVTNAADGTVTRLNPANNKVQATIPVGPAPFQLAAAGGGMWVATQNAAVKVDPGSDRVALRVPYPGDAKIPSQGGVGLDADERAVWVSTAVGTVLRLRPDNGRLVATIRVLPDKATSPGSVAIDGDHVWVSNWALDYAARPGAGEPRLGSTVGVVDIDARSNQIVHRVPSAGYPVSGMLPRQGSLYMIGGYDRSRSSVLIRADWPYQVLTSVRPVGGNSFDVLAANGSLWVPSWDENALYVLPDVDGATS
jgi:YVTN family beta-propeller protein